MTSPDPAPRRHPVPPRPPSGAAGRKHMEPAHRAQRVRSVERYLTKVLTTWPPLRAEDRRHLADILLTEPPAPPTTPVGGPS